MKNCHQIILVATCAIFAGCATALAPGADQIQVVTSGQKEQQCKSLGIVTTEQRLGPNKPGNAMSKALNEVARKGGNGIYIVATSMDWAEGASVTAEALRCTFS